MLTLPIKRKWLDKIMSGEKKEEYREIKHYYTVRFRSFMTYAPCSDEQTLAAIKSTGEEGVSYEMILRGGYDLSSPAALVSGRLFVGKGKPEWGAVPGKDYYVLRIDKCEVLCSKGNIAKYKEAVYGRDQNKM